MDNAVRIKQVVMLIVSKMMTTEDDNELLSLQAALALLDVAASADSKDVGKLVSEAMTLIQ